MLRHKLGELAYQLIMVSQRKLKIDAVTERSQAAFVEPDRRLRGDPALYSRAGVAAPDLKRCAVVCDSRERVPPAHGGGLRRKIAESLQVQRTLGDLQHVPGRPGLEASGAARPGKHLPQPGNADVDLALGRRGRGVTPDGIDKKIYSHGVASFE
jgi:hypothetical protein